jgi:hypothetical protein
VCAELYFHSPLPSPCGLYENDMMWFTGSVQNHDALCVLPLNILNEKIFIFLWFWFIILSLLSGLALLYSIGITVYRPLRQTVLKRRFKFTVPGGVATIVAKTQVSSTHVLLLKLVHVCIMDAFRW